MMIDRELVFDDRAEKVERRRPSDWRDIEREDIVCIGRARASGVYSKDDEMYRSAPKRDSAQWSVQRSGGLMIRGRGREEEAEANDDDDATNTPRQHLSQ